MLQTVEPTNNGSDRKLWMSITLSQPDDAGKRVAIVMSLHSLTRARCQAREPLGHNSNVGIGLGQMAPEVDARFWAF